MEELVEFTRFSLSPKTRQLIAFDDPGAAAAEARFLADAKQQAACNPIVAKAATVGGGGCNPMW